MKNWKSWILSGFATTTLALTGCAPECVDASDCASKSAAEGRAYTCVSGNCTPGSPFVDAGLGGGGGSTGGGGGSTGGGGGSTGGGGGGDTDAGTDAGMDTDAGTDAGMDTDAGTDAGMDTDAGTDAGMDVDAGTDAGMDMDAGTTDDQIVAVRAAADTITDGGVVGLTISGALVTYVKPLVLDAGTSDPAGFFIQGTNSALFVALDPATINGGPLAVGDLVDIDVQTVSRVGGIRQVVAVSSVTRSSSGNPVSGLAVSISNVDFTAANAIEPYDLRLVNIDGTVSTEPVSAGGGYRSVNVATMGTPDAGGALVRLRLPSALMDAQAFGPGCTFSVSTTPLWRFNNVAQPSAWLQSEVSNIVCPAPAPISANASSSTGVTVSFSRDLSPASVTTGAFTVAENGGGALAVSDATLSSPRSVALTTAAQNGGATYTVTVAPSVTDTRGTGVSPTANTTTFVGAAGNVCMPGVVISAVFGGNSATNPFNQDFVELHNRTSAPVSLANWSIQYASATGTTWAVNALSGTIAAGGYHLVGLAASTGGTAIPTADSTPSNPSNLSGTNGKVALVNSTTALTGSCPRTTNASVVDFLGYGTADCFEGTVHPALTSTTATVRNGMGCADTNVNSADFTAGAATAPRNSASAANACVCQ